MKNLIVLCTCFCLVGIFNANAQFGFVKKVAKSAKKHTVNTAKKVGSATKSVGKSVLNGASTVGQYGATGVRTAGSYGVRGAKSVGRGVKKVGKGSARGAQNMINSSVGKAIVRTASAPGKSVYNATKVVRGKANVLTIYKPYMEAVVGNVKVAAKTATKPQRTVYRKVKKAIN